MPLDLFFIVLYFQCLLMWFPCITRRNIIEFYLWALYLVLGFHYTLTGCLEVWGYFYHYFTIMLHTYKQRTLGEVECTRDLTCLIMMTRCPLCMNVKKWNAPQQSHLKALSFPSRGDHLFQYIHVSISHVLHQCPITTANNRLQL